MLTNGLFAQQRGTMFSTGAAPAPPPYHIIDDDHEKYKCCCATHVRQAATIIAITFLVFNVLSLGGGNMGALIGIVVCALVIYGDKKEKAWAYLPSLVLQGIGLVILAILAAFLLLSFVGLLFMQNPFESSDNAGIHDPDYLHTIIEQRQYTPEDEKRAREFFKKIWPLIHVYVFIGFLLSLAFLGLYGWLWHITLRAYRYMRDVVEPQKWMRLPYVAGAAIGREKDPHAFHA